MNQWQQMELDTAEKKLMNILFGQTTIPDRTARILNCLKINPNHYIQKVENKIELVLDNDGRVNGKTLKKMISFWKPEITKVIEIPETNFRLVEVVEPAIKYLFPKRFENENI